MNGRQHLARIWGIHLNTPPRRKHHHAKAKATEENAINKGGQPSAYLQAATLIRETGINRGGSSLIPSVTETGPETTGLCLQDEEVASVSGR